MKRDNFTDKAPPIGPYNQAVLKETHSMLRAKLL
jgi:hypothetical protein